MNSIESQRNSLDHSGVDVCLVNMPYAGIERPSTSLGLLQAILEKAGLSVITRHENLSFAGQVGTRHYHLIQSTRSEELLGEWTFRRSAFPDFEPEDQSYLDQVFDRLPIRRAQPSKARETEDSADTLESQSVNDFEPERQQFTHAARAIRDAAEAFVEKAAREILELRPRIVACTSTFQQHVPALALLRIIRELDPTVITMLGGSNCESIMGITTHEAFDWVDYVVSGEADDLISDLVKLVLDRGQRARGEEIPYGVFAPIHRQEGYPGIAGSNVPIPRAVARSLDESPTPNYFDYFEALEHFAHRKAVTPGIPIETSRGCWWGEKKHCTFCGLNGTGMTFRSKSPESTINSFDELASRHGLKSFEVVDNILDMKYFDTVLPTLAERSFRIFYETKSNLRRDHLKSLASSGITWIQPGIESLHTNILNLMDKGAQGWMNIQLLRWAREYGVRLSWNFLFGFPGEDDDDYEQMADWIPKLTHLQPPYGVIKVRFDRFSPYHYRMKDYSLDLVPNRFYSSIYPYSEEQLENQAVFFEDRRGQKNESSPGARSEQTINGDASFYCEPGIQQQNAEGIGKAGAERPGLKRLQGECSRWSKAFWDGLPPLLCEETVRGQTRILDTRSIARKRLTLLTDTEACVLAACDNAAQVSTLAEKVATQSEGSASRQEIEDAIERLIACDFLLEVDGRMIALTLKGDIPQLPGAKQFPGGFLDIWPSQNVDLSDASSQGSGKKSSSSKPLKVETSR